VRLWVQSLPATDHSGSALLCHCPRQTRRRVQPGEDRSARGDHVVSASVALPGREHARTGGDSGAEPGGGASAACFTATHPVGVSPSKTRSARTLTFDQPRSAGAGPLVERANFFSLGPASACLDQDPSANGASSALKLAGADQRPNK
jgi:hypothetical protein